MCICIQRCTEKSGRCHFKKKRTFKKKMSFRNISTIVGGGVSESPHLNSWVEIPPGQVCGSHSGLQCALSWGRGSTESGVRRPSLATVTQLTAWRWRSPFPSLGLFLHLQNKDVEREAPGNFHSNQYSSSCVELTSARAVILKGWGNCINEKIRLGNVVGSGEVYGKQEFSCTAKGNNLCLTLLISPCENGIQSLFSRDQ